MRSVRFKTAAPRITSTWQHRHWRVAKRRYRHHKTGGVGNGAALVLDGDAQRLGNQADTPIGVAAQDVKSLLGILRNRQSTGAGAFTPLDGHVGEGEVAESRRRIAVP